MTKQDQRFDDELPEGFFTPEGTVYRRLIYTPAAILTVNISQTTPGGPWHLNVEINSQRGYSSAQEAAEVVNRLVANW